MLLCESMRAALYACTGLIPLYIYVYIFVFLPKHGYSMAYRGIPLAPPMLASVFLRDHCRDSYGEGKRRDCTARVCVIAFGLVTVSARCTGDLTRGVARELHA
jgi:hypothetical protein